MVPAKKNRHFFLISGFISSPPSVMGLSTDIWGRQLARIGNTGWGLFSCDQWVVYEGSIFRPMISGICLKM